MSSRVRSTAGPFPLETAETPVFAIVTGSDKTPIKIFESAKEVEVQDVPVLAVIDGASEVERFTDAMLAIPGIRLRAAPVLANVQPLRGKGVRAADR